MRQSLLPDCLRYTVSYSVSHLDSYTGFSPDKYTQGIRNPTLTVSTELADPLGIQWCSCFELFP